MIAGLPLMALGAFFASWNVSLSPLAVMQRAVKSGQATTTLTVDTRPPSLGDGETATLRLIYAARTAQRLVRAPATLRRITHELGLPADALLGTASPYRIEFVPERRDGTRDQRSYALVRAGAPYEVSADVFVSEPLVLVTVRAPSARRAERVAELLPGALNAELNALAGGPDRASIVVANRAGVVARTRGASAPLISFLVFIVIALLWASLRLTLRAGRAGVVR